MLKRIVFIMFTVAWICVSFSSNLFPQSRYIGYRYSIKVNTSETDDDYGTTRNLMHSSILRVKKPWKSFDDGSIEAVFEFEYEAGCVSTIPVIISDDSWNSDFVTSGNGWNFKYSGSGRITVSSIEGSVTLTSVKTDGSRRITRTMTFSGKVR